MGVIQNALNQSMAAAAAAAYGLNDARGKAIAEGEAASKEVADVGKEALDIAEEVKGHEAKQANLNKEYQALQDVGKTVKTEEDLKAYNELAQGLYDEEAKAQTARAATQSRIIAQKARAERIEKAMARGRE